MPRPISFEQACSLYTLRFTLEHVPPWGRRPSAATGLFYAPNYVSDREWYDNTLFPGDTYPNGERVKFAQSRHHTFPLGRWLTAPYQGV